MITTIASKINYFQHLPDLYAGEERARYNVHCTRKRPYHNLGMNKQDCNQGVPYRMGKGSKGARVSQGRRLQGDLQGEQQL